jgi:hypothetical protein
MNMFEMLVITCEFCVAGRDGDAVILSRTAAVARMIPLTTTSFHKVSVFFVKQ